jgi:outer membrane receptor protein involved in Fe transport
VVSVGAGARSLRVDAVLRLSLSADVTVTGSRTFGNLADVPDPARNLIGIAESASQGAITARQLRARPLMRTGEVLETVPGVVISQHSGEGKANDQVPLRAIDAGIIGRFGALDPSDGGDSSRYSGSLEWQRTRGNTVTRLSAYGIRYSLNLFSNFTFFLDDPVHGDQFHQADRRFVTGAKLSQRRLTRWSNRTVQTTYGVQRNDDIPVVALSHTEARRPLETIRRDRVIQSSVAAYGQNDIAWTPWLRTLAGVRIDGYRFDVTADDAANSGLRRASLVSPKSGLVIGPFRATELYVSAGLGFHSNDARGATITRDPRTGDAAAAVTPLVRATGSEVGIRTVAVPHMQTTATLWRLDLASELVFAGDAGTTEAGRSSRRYGFELTNYFSPWRQLTFDGDLSWSDARFTDPDSAGDRIPGSVRTVLAAGGTVEDVHRISGSVGLRAFGRRALVEDGSVTSKPTSLVNLDGGYALSPRLRVSFDLFNALDANASDIDYFYVSRLRGEPPDGVADVHLHPALPRTARISLSASF